MFFGRYERTRMEIQHGQQPLREGGEERELWAHKYRCIKGLVLQKYDICSHLALMQSHHADGLVLPPVFEISATIQMQYRGMEF